MSTCIRPFSATHSGPHPARRCALAWPPRCSAPSGSGSPASSKAQGGTPFTQRAPACSSERRSRPNTRSPRSAQAAAAPAVPRPTMATVSISASCHATVSALQSE